jgi:hypothetical protein
VIGGHVGARDQAAALLGDALLGDALQQLRALL